MKVLMKRIFLPIILLLLSHSAYAVLQSALLQPQLMGAIKAKNETSFNALVSALSLMKNMQQKQLSGKEKDSLLDLDVVQKVGDISQWYVLSMRSKKDVQEDR